jgi:hypothetical protein
VTRKDYITLADALGNAAPPVTPTYPQADAQWSTDCNIIAQALAEDSGYDRNGNRRFDWDRFMTRISATAAKRGR